MPALEEIYLNHSSLLNPNSAIGGQHSSIVLIGEALATETPSPEFSRDQSVHLVAAGILAIMR
jgi:hypothetical protein